MNLSYYAAVHKFFPFARRQVVEQLRTEATHLMGNDSGLDKACAFFVAAGFFSMSLGDFKIAAAITDSLDAILTRYEKTDGTHAQKMRAHCNILLLRSAVLIFTQPKKYLVEHYDDIQKNLSQVVIEGSKFGKGWKLGQVKASQLQLYVDWIAHGPSNAQTWRTAVGMVGSTFGQTALKTATQDWFKYSRAGWGDFIINLRKRSVDGETLPGNTRFQR